MHVRMYNYKTYKRDYLYLRNQYGGDSDDDDKMLIAIISRITYQN